MEMNLGTAMPLRRLKALVGNSIVSISPSQIFSLLLSSMCE